MGHILSLDQGTTSSRAIVFDASQTPIASAQQEFTQHFPEPGWVEHDADDLLQTTLQTARQAIANAGIDVSDIAGIGITNQRETVVVWERSTGTPIHKAIVWQDRRTADFCTELRNQGHEPLVTRTTGLLLDPYFSATKLTWLLDNVEGARTRAEAGELCFGTVDSWLIWHLTGGKSHVTDATNAARTMLFDINQVTWSAEMCALFRVPMAMLPEVKDCAADFGTTEPGILGAPVPIFGVAGDQQAATLGQACFEPGMVKSTYGTGCFALLNTGAEPVASQNRLLTTIAYQLNGETTYALEGSIFIAGAVVQWLRDGLKIIRQAGDTAALAEAAERAQNIIMVPAFTGLGAPYWQPSARGAVFGLTRNTGAAELSLAALQSVGFQTRDLVEAMAKDRGQQAGDVLRVDGGMSASDPAMQFLADILGAPVDRPTVLETTALGAAWLAGQRAGVWPDQAEFAKSWSLEQRFHPAWDEGQREAAYQRWKAAINAVMSFHDVAN